MTRTLAVVALFAAGCSRPAPPPPADPPPPTPAEWFRDVTAGSGLDVTYRNGEEADRFAILESLGGGAAAFDFDGDGKLDLLFATGGGFGADRKSLTGHPPKLYRNRGDLKFEDVSPLLPTPAGDWFYSHGVAVTDYDRDGWPDVLLTGYGRVALFHNEPAPGGGRRFADVTEKAGLLGEPIFATGAVWADLDGDGFPDLYVCDYCDWSNANDPTCPGVAVGVARDVCAPKYFGTRPHRLFRNRGDGTFADVTRTCGLRADRPDRDYGKGLGVLAVDLDGDGRPELYVANDTTDNFLYRNRSTPGVIRLEEQGFALGVARDGGGMANGSMGVDAADFDGTGRPSLWVTNYENEYHALYQNRSAGDQLRFAFHSPAAGVTAIGPVYVGWGTAFADFDGDGWEDLVILNGHVLRKPPKDNLAQPPVLLRNVPRGSGRGFADARPRGGGYFARPHRGRGLVVADLDDDGRPDLVACHVNEPAAVLRNEAPAGRWLGVRLVGRDRRDVVGATVRLRSGDRTLTRFARAGRGYLSHSDDRLLFALGDAPAGRLTVNWPSGDPPVEHFDGLAAGRYHRIEQGTGTP